MIVWIVQGCFPEISVRLPIRIQLHFWMIDYDFSGFISSELSGKESTRLPGGLFVTPKPALNRARELSARIRLAQSLVRHETIDVCPFV